MNFIGLQSTRINRLSYFLTTLLSMFVFVAVGLLLSSVITAVFGPADPSMPESPHPLGLLPLMVLWFVYYFLIASKRFHDMNMSGWLSLCSILPFVGIVFGIMLLFVGGTDGKNKYGEPHKGLQIMGFGTKQTV